MSTGADATFLVCYTLDGNVKWATNFVGMM